MVVLVGFRFCRFPAIWPAALERLSQVESGRSLFAERGGGAAPKIRKRHGRKGRRTLRSAFFSADDSKAASSPSSLLRGCCSSVFFQRPIVGGPRSGTC